VADSGEIDLGNGNVFRVYDVQVFAGYIVHIGVVSSSAAGEGPITVGDKATCKVDYERRRDVAPNHTMTHVLNYALRKVLGPEIDQRGSLVDDEKLRFDFSYKKALTASEIKEVEDTVRAVIENAMPVDTSVIPLKEAQAISSLRAVFGEAYPDPVRVVSVGAKVLDMQSAPSEEKWGGYSVELCGGTHVMNTAEAESFVITEETAIAKGVRRMVAVTRGAAASAERKGAELASRVRSLTNAALSEAAPLLGPLREEVDASGISAGLKPVLRDELTAVGKKVMEKKKKEMAALTDVRIQSAKEAAQQAISEGAKSLVHVISLGLDAKLINKVINAVSKEYPELPFMAVSEEEPGSQGAVLCVSWIPKQQVEAGLIASEWNAAALAKWGGKGGGKPNSAQARATTCDDLEGLQQSARDFATSKLA